MSLSIQDWHNRFMLQAQWTRALRLYFFDLIKLEAADKILDIGCGTGALLPDLQSLSPADIYGADVSLDPLERASQLSPESDLIGANVHNLPFKDNAFDMVLSHYFLMWVGDTSHALQEMARVTKPGGYVVAFAEPDYGGESIILQNSSNFGITRYPGYWMLEQIPTWAGSFPIFFTKQTFRRSIAAPTMEDGNHLYPSRILSPNGLFWKMILDNP